MFFVPACWLGMQTVHELGHAIGAWVSGAEIQKIVLYPWTISRTDVRPNPNPLLVVWLGPIVGAGIPAVLALGSYRRKFTGFFLLRFFAGFCLIANGGYIGAGSLEAIGDCGTMLKYGSPIWTLWLFGGVSFAAGFLFWNQLGRYFGLGPNRRALDPQLEWVAAGLLAMLLLFNWGISLLTG